LSSESLSRGTRGIWNANAMRAWNDGNSIGKSNQLRTVHCALCHAQQSGSEGSTHLQRSDDGRVYQEQPRKHHDACTGEKGGGREILGARSEIPTLSPIAFLSIFGCKAIHYMFRCCILRFSEVEEYTRDPCAAYCSHEMQRIEGREHTYIPL
jgi:hypothetical protein